MKIFKLGDWKDILIAVAIFPILIVLMVMLIPVTAGLGLLAIFIPSVMISVGAILIGLFILSLFISIFVRKYFRERKSNN